MLVYVSTSMSRKLLESRSQARLLFPIPAWAHMGRALTRAGAGGGVTDEVPRGPLVERGYSLLISKMERLSGD